MKTLWLVRHGMSQAQTGEGGGWDPDLTEHGRMQAERLVSVLASASFDIAFLSPLLRARRTFELSQAQAGQVQFDSRLVECSFGRSYASLLPYHTPGYGRPDKEQAWDEPVGSRLKQFVTDLRKAPGERILIVGHWAYFSLLGQHMLGQERLSDPIRGETQHSLFMDNAAVSKVGLDYERYGDVILQWNVREHLAGLLAGKHTLER